MISDGVAPTSRQKLLSPARTLESLAGARAAPLRRIQRLSAVRGFLTVIGILSEYVTSKARYDNLL